MKISSNLLLEDITRQLEQYIADAEALKTLPLTSLNWRASETSWNVLECLEHLSLYADFYVPEIKKSIASSTHREPAPIFVSSWLGNYFAKSMLPKEKLNKMKTFKDKNPLGSQLGYPAIDRFIQLHRQLLALVQAAKKVDLNKTKTGISITKLLRLKLGDTFRFVVNHVYRHMVQVQKALAAQKG
jgi:hypothetical protein